MMQLFAVTVLTPPVLIIHLFIRFYFKNSLKAYSWPLVFGLVTVLFFGQLLVARLRITLGFCS